MQNNIEKKNSSQTFLKGAMVLSISMIVVKLCGMIYKIMLTKIYSEIGDNFGGIGSGLFANAYELYIPLFTLATAGFPIAVSRLISESVAQNRYKDVKLIHKVSKPFFIIMGLICFLLMMGLSFFYVDFIDSPDALPAMMMLSPAIFFGCIVSIYRGYFEGQRNMTPTAISEIVEAAVKMILGLSMSYLVIRIGKNEIYTKGTLFGQYFAKKSDALSTLTSYSVAVAVLAISLGGLFSYIALRIIYSRSKNVIPQEYFENSVDARTQKETFRMLLKTAIPVGLAALVMSISSTVDAVIIQRVLLNTAQTNRETFLAQFGGNLDNLIPLDKSEEIKIHTYLWGAFGNALTIMQLVTAVTQVFGTSAMPSVTNAYTKGDKEDLRTSISTVLKLTSLVTFPAGIGMCVLSSPIMRLLYESEKDPYLWQIGGKILCVMGISVIFIAISTPICSMLQGVGRIDMPLKLYSIAMILKIALNYVFVSIVSINVIGGAVGSLVAYLFVCIVGMYFLIKKAGVVPDFVNSMLKPFFSSLVCGAVAYLSYDLLTNIMPSAVATLGSIAVAAIFYIIALLLLHTFSENEVKMLPKGKKVVTILAKLHLLR